MYFSILVITDDKEDYVNKIKMNCSGMIAITRLRDYYIIKTDFIHYFILSDVPEQSKGKKFDKIILEKEISDEVYHNILIPMTFSNIIKPWKIS